MKAPYRFRKRPNSSNYYVMFRNDGKWISTGETTLEGAERFAIANMDAPSPHRAITFAELSYNFFIRGKCSWVTRQEAIGRTLRVSNLQKCRGILENYLLPKFGHMDIRDITRRAVQDWLIGLKSMQRTPLGYDMKNKILATLRHIMHEAEDREIIQRDPTLGMPMFRGEVEKKEVFTIDELQILFPIDIEKLLDNFLTLEWATYFFLQASTGMRPSEVGALQWPDWIRSKHGIIVRHALESVTRKVKGTKTGQIKAIPLVDRAEQLLLLIEPKSTGQFIFEINGEPIKLETALKHFKRSTERAGLGKTRTPYSLRHSFDTHALKVLSPDNVRDLMGHRTLKHTIGTYYHPTDEDRLEALPDGVRKELGELWGQ